MEVTISFDPTDATQLMFAVEMMKPYMPVTKPDLAQSAWQSGDKELRYELIRDGAFPVAATVYDPKQYLGGSTIPGRGGRAWAVNDKGLEIIKDLYLQGLSKSAITKAFGGVVLRSTVQRFLAKMGKRP